MSDLTLHSSIVLYLTAIRCKLRSQIREQSEKLAYIREQLVFKIEEQRVAEKNAARKNSNVNQWSSDSSSTDGETIDVDATDVF